MGFRRAIAHVDADAFFASVEQALHPEYRGRPLVTGLERNIVAAASYEAKAMGIKRGVALWDVRKICPDCIIVPSDYETYSLYSLRLFNILRRYSPDIEEASIDEAYLDLTGVSRLHRKGYRAIAEAMQKETRDELGIGISIGVSLSKSLAKLASKFRKPMGITAVPEEYLPDFRKRRKASDICGIGPRSTALLHKHGVETVEDYINLSEGFVRHLLGKIGVELWLELQGAMVNPVVAGAVAPKHTIMKSKTFAPPSTDPEFIRAHAIRNLESACIKARRHDLLASSIRLFLRKQDFRYDEGGFELPQRSNLPTEVAPRLLELFSEIHDPATVYRSTGVVLGDLAVDEANQYSLFDDVDRSEKTRMLYDAVGDLSVTYGKHIVSAGTGLYLKRKIETSRAKKPARKSLLLKGETPRRRLGLPKWEIEL